MTVMLGEMHRYKTAETGSEGTSGDIMLNNSNPDNAG